MSNTLIFDIGKTNKKCFVFDQDYQEVHKEYSRFDEVVDEDGFPCDNLPALHDWLQRTFQQISSEASYDVRAINFSTYGASFVHIDKNGEPLTPLYNYLKPYPPELLQEFYAKYGPAENFAAETASPTLAMLNSGLQLFWLKYTRPEIFAQIRWSLHFPQYISFLFTGIPVSEFTSIGCHTGLWDFSRQDYHRWVYEEEIDRILPPIVDTNTSINKRYHGRIIKVGVGIHDSSAALLPYIRADRKPFFLISTGTWSITINPFNDEVLSAEDLQHDCLNFMRINGQAVKAARLFLGNEYKLQIGKLQQHFGKEKDAHKLVRFNETTYRQLKQNYERTFAFESLQIERQQPEQTDLTHFNSFEEAYHQLMLELVELQIEAAERAKGGTAVRKLYIDGGFADNDLFVKMIALHFDELKLRTTQSPLGSALGAAMVISEAKVQKKFLKKNYAMKKPFVQMPK